MFAKRRSVHRSQRKHAFRFEPLENRLVLCVSGFVDGEFINYCLPDLPAAAPADVSRAADAVSQFAGDLYQHYEAESGNIFLSPLSIAAALAMAYAGAAGETAEEMERVLHLGSEPGIHESFRALLEYRAGADDPFELEVANAQWPALSFPVLDEFARRIADDYGGTTQALDYSQPEAAAETINAWVARQTQFTVRDLIQPDQLSPATVMVLTNAMYFNASWAIPFDPQSTGQMPFTREDGESVMVPMMYQEGAFRYTEHDGYQILELPYQEAAASMVFVMPGMGQDSHDLAPGIWRHVDGWLESNPASVEVNIHLPKFKTTVPSSLNEVLKGMGMPTAFTGRADFSNMTPGGGPWIDFVSHKAFAEVNEQGTEAGAATAIAFEICFAAGTPILTAEGETPIEQLKPGDRVLARDEHNVEADNELKTVEQTFQRVAKVVELHVDGQVIQTTSEHPFFVRGRGWTKASYLEAGYLLATSDAGWARLEKVVATDREQIVYNLRVADHHTYFVGSRSWGFAVWAHNRCGGEYPEFIANRPFHFMIRDNATSVPLFMGRVTDPLSEERDSITPTVQPADEPLPGDIDGDDDVDFTDFLILSANFGKSDAVWRDGDLNGDGGVSFEDYLVLANNFGRRRVVAATAAEMIATDEFFSRQADEPTLKEVLSRATRPASVFDADANLAFGTTWSSVHS